MKVLHTLCLLTLTLPLAMHAQMDMPGVIIYPDGSFPGMGRGGDVPVNDECTGAVPQLLEPFSGYTFSGNNTGASVMEGTPFTVVWEAFILEQCATITVNHCLAGSMFTSFMNVITNNCPATGSGTLTATTTTKCTMIWEDVPPGTWYMPVLADPLFAPEGEYSFEVSAMECDQAYCPAGGESQEHTGSIVGISFSDVLYFEEASGTGYVHHLMETAQVGTGVQYPIAITLDDAGDPVGDFQVLVYIDFNQNGILSDPGELVFIGLEPSVGNTYTGSITIPETAMLGTTRMRIRLHDLHDGSEYANETNSSPCGLSTFGQVHDLQVSIDLGTDISSREKGNIVLYPNPGNGDLYLSGWNASGTSRLEVFDATGRAVYLRDINNAGGERIHLPLQGLHAGSYVLRVNWESENFQRVIIIE